VSKREEAETGKKGGPLKYECWKAAKRGKKILVSENGILSAEKVLGDDSRHMRWGTESGSGETLLGTSTAERGKEKLEEGERRPRLTADGGLA